MNVLATVGCVVALGFLLFAEYIRARLPEADDGKVGAFEKMRIRAKVAASVAFLVVGASSFSGAVEPERVAFDRFIFVGLVLGAVGDVALLGRGKRAFLWGLGAFLSGHLAYLVAVAFVLDPRYWLAIAGWPGLAPIVVGSFAHEWLKPHLGKLKLAVGSYILVITAMVVAAIATARSGVLPDGDSTCFALGACLFFASDFAVARERFVARDFTNKLWGLPTYYTGQLLIAWAIA